MTTAIAGAGGPAIGLQDLRAPSPPSCNATATLLIRGMTYAGPRRLQLLTFFFPCRCAACVATVENGVKSLLGVNKVAVSLMAERGTVLYDQALLAPTALVDHVNELGYDAALLSVDRGAATAGGADEGHVAFAVGGMTCASCSASIEGQLLALPGIAKATVNLITAMAKVQYDTRVVGVRTIRDVIEGAGFTAALVKQYDAGDTTNTGSSSNSIKQLRQEEARRWRALLVFASVFAVPMVLLAMIFPLVSPVELPLSQPAARGVSVSAVVQLVLATPVQFYVGWRFLVGAFKALRHKSANMDVLVASGTLIAYLFSVGSLVGSLVNPEYEPMYYFEVSVLLITFIVLGKYIECLAKGKTSEALTKLMDMQSKTAILLVMDDGIVVDEQEIDVDLLQRGDTVKVVPGAKIPVDGAVVRGTSLVDESAITGESVPVSKQEGSKVVSGTINQQGLLHVQATHVGADTMLAQIVRLVEDAQTNKAPIQAVADRIAGVFVPCVVAVAVLVFCVWIGVAFGGVLPPDYYPPNEPPAVFALLFMVTVLVIACPCAIGLATPTAIMAGTGVAAAHGILIKGGEPLEALAKVDTVVFDKTGTLTVGRPSVVAIVSTDEGQLSAEQLLRIAGSAESGSQHPLGRAVYDHARAACQPLLECSHFTSLPGLGVTCVVDGRRVSIGNREWMASNNLCASLATEGAIQQAESSGQTCVLVAIDGRIAGWIALADTVKPDAEAVVRYLIHTAGLDVFMLTGDNIRVAHAIASQLGLAPDKVKKEISFIVMKS